MIYSLAVVSESNTDFSCVEVGLHDVSFTVLMFYAFCSKPSASFHSGTFFLRFSIPSWESVFKRLTIVHIVHAIRLPVIVVGFVLLVSPLLLLHHTYICYDSLS